MLPVYAGTAGAFDFLYDIFVKWLESKFDVNDRFHI